jgi:hypothetical protein
VLTLLEAHFTEKEYASFSPSLWSFWISAEDDAEADEADGHAAPAHDPSRSDMMHRRISAEEHSSSDVTTARSSSLPSDPSSLSTSLSSAYAPSASPGLYDPSSSASLSAMARSRQSTADATALELRGLTSPSPSGGAGAGAPGTVVPPPLPLSPPSERQRGVSASGGGGGPRSRSSSGVSVRLWPTPHGKASSAQRKSPGTGGAPSGVVVVIVQLSHRVAWLTQSAVETRPEDEEFILERLALVASQREEYTGTWRQEWAVFKRALVRSVYDVNVVSPHLLVPDAPATCRFCFC